MPTSIAVFTKAVGDLKKAGATIVDPAGVDSLQQILRGGGNCSRFKYDLEKYFSERGEGAPVKTVDAIVRSRAYHPSVEVRLTAAQRDTSPAPDANPGCKAREAMLWATNQEDYMLAAFGDPQNWKKCVAMFGCGGPAESSAGSEALNKQNLDKAKELLKEAGYKGEPVVLLDPTDISFLHQMTLVAAETLKSSPAT